MLQENEPNEEIEPERITMDADTVKELIEMKFVTKQRKIRFRSPQQRIVSRECEVLVYNDSTTHTSVSSRNTENLMD